LRYILGGHLKTGQKASMPNVRVLVLDNSTRAIGHGGGQSSKEPRFELLQLLGRERIC
jgi:hypothetical protein